jgi:hypothetical protein
MLSAGVVDVICIPFAQRNETAKWKDRFRMIDWMRSLAHSEDRTTRQPSRVQSKALIRIGSDSDAHAHGPAAVLGPLCGQIHSKTYWAKTNNSRLATFPIETDLSDLSIQKVAIVNVNRLT